MFLIAGLGNPGSKYRNTRHNAGFLLLDLLATRLRKTFGPGPGGALTCRARIRGESVLLAKPQDYMNQSGKAVREILARFPIELHETLVAYDEYALPLGRIRLRRGGSAAGHNGMQSVIDTLGTDRIPRLRIGIAGDQEVYDRSRFVLSDFEEDEEDILEEVLQRSLEAVEVFVSQGLERAMSMFNREQLKIEPDER